MGSCFSETVSKYEIYQQPRIYQGDLQNQHVDESKYKSKSSKSYKGTNTFEDIQHQNQPIRGDIYSHLRSKNLLPTRTMPNIQLPDPAQDINYGLNPYVEKEEIYKRSNTDNPLHVFQKHLNSQKPNENFAISMVEKQNRNNNRNPENKTKKSSKKDNVNMKVTESRYVSP